MPLERWDRRLKEAKEWRKPGRPRKAERTKILNVRLDAQQHDALRSAAADTGSTMSAIVERAIMRELMR